MAKPGEECTVVFALIVTEPAGVCMCHSPLAGSVTIYAKITVYCSPDSSTFGAVLSTILAPEHTVL